MKTTISSIARFYLPRNTQAVPAAPIVSAVTTPKNGYVQIEFTPPTNRTDSSAIAAGEIAAYYIYYGVSTGRQTPQGSPYGRRYIPVSVLTDNIGPTWTTPPISVGSLSGTVYLTISAFSIYGESTTSTEQSIVITQGPYNVHEQIANIRTHYEYGTYFSERGDKIAPDGLEAPKPPRILQTILCNSIAELIAQLSTGNNKQLVLNPANSPYNLPEELYEGTPSIAIQRSDTHVVFNDCVINGAVNAPIFQVSDNFGSPERIKVSGGTLNGGIGTARGSDIHYHKLNLIGRMNPASSYSSSCGGFYGKRILTESCIVRGYSNGYFFTGGWNKAQFSASVSGNVLTVSGFWRGQLEVGDVVQVGFHSTPGAVVVMPVGTHIIAFGTGTGGDGTYILNNSDCSWPDTASLICIVRSANLIMANCDVEVPDQPPASTWPHENASRFNGVHCGVIMHSRLLCNPKASLRVHADYACRQGSKYVLFLDNQIEGGAGTLTSEPGNSGIFPACEAMFFDGNRFYNPIAAMVPRVPYYANHGVDIDGNGTLAYVSVGAGQSLNHGFDAGEVVNVQAANTDFSNPAAVMTLVTNQQASYPCTAVTTKGFAPGSIIRTGLGNGYLTGGSIPNQSVSVQTITVDFTSATAFTVTGSVSGSLGTGTVGTPFTSAQANFTIYSSYVAFVATDRFTFRVGYLTTANVFRTKVLNDYVWWKNNLCYVAGLPNNTGMPGTIFEPYLNGVPPAHWTTVTDASISYANDNIVYTYSSTPAYSIASTS